MRCPHCDIEIPSASNYCMDCGETLNAVSKNEIGNLREEIKEIKKKNRRLSKEKSKISSHVDDLAKQLLEQKNEVEQLCKEKSRLEEIKQQQQNQLQKKAKQPLKLIIISSIVAVLLFLSLTFVISNSSNKKQKQDLERQISNLENKIKPLQAEYDFIPKNYKVIVDRAYFYNDSFNRKDAYMLYGEEVLVIRIKGKFACGIYNNSTYVWLRLSDIKQKQ